MAWPLPRSSLRQQSARMPLHICPSSQHSLLFIQVMTNVQPEARFRPRRSGSETQASAPLSGQTRTPG